MEGDNKQRFNKAELTFDYKNILPYRPAMYTGYAAIFAQNISLGMNHPSKGRIIPADKHLRTQPPLSLKCTRTTTHTGVYMARRLHPIKKNDTFARSSVNNNQNFCVE